MVTVDAAVDAVIAAPTKWLAEFPDNCVGYPPIPASDVSCLVSGVRSCFSVPRVTVDSPRIEAVSVEYTVIRLQLRFDY